MNVKYDSKTKTVTLSFQYDPNKVYNYSKGGTGKKPQVATTGGFLVVPGTDCRVSMNAMCEEREGQSRS